MTSRRTGISALAEKQDVEAMHAAEERFKAEKRKIETKLDEQRETIRNRKG